MWVFALRSPFVPAEGFCWSKGGVEEDSSITQVHPHGSSVWQTMQRYNAAGDRRKRRFSGSVSDTEVKIQTSSRQRQLAVLQPAPSPPPPSTSSLAGLAEKLHKCTEKASIDSSAISWRQDLFIFHRVAAVFSFPHRLHAVWRFAVTHNQEFLSELNWL